MQNLLTNTYEVHQGEFQTAGDASASIKRKLKQLGVDSAVLRRVAVASYEAELISSSTAWAASSPWRWTPSVSC